jgi:hypothetical protein
MSATWARLLMHAHLIGLWIVLAQVAPLEKIETKVSKRVVALSLHSKFSLTIGVTFQERIKHLKMTRDLFSGPPLAC